MLINKTEKLTDYEKRRQQAQRQAERYRAKRLAQMDDPAWKEAQVEKQREYNRRALERQRKKQQNAPVSAVLAVKKPVQKRKATYGMKGRPPTAEERRHMDQVGKLPCAACYLHGVMTWLVSLHHTAGRVEAGAHMKVLPLCDHHHQHAAPAAIRAQYPWLIPLHADMSIGGKAAFAKENATEGDLLVLVKQMINSGAEVGDGVFFLPSIV